jgi:CheY-like chemotaxis protein
VENEEPKILYVEDDPKSRLIVKKLLEKVGCRVFEAVDGQQGVEMAVNVNPDAILMDIMLPVMDGLEATKKIRKTKKIADTPIIAITAKAMAGDREKILNAGCNEYIAKPIDLHVLLQLLSQVLNKELSLEKPPKQVEKPVIQKSISKTILLVDDTPKNILVLEKILKSEGYTILTASNGKKALQVLTDDVDLIISDIAMPVMDGYQLCYNVMKNPETRNVHFIFYSSHYSNQDEVAFGLALGADTYMVRPLHIDELITHIKEILNTEKVPPPLMSVEEFQQQHTRLLTSKMIEIAPKREPFEKINPTPLEIGRSYLIKEKTPKKSYSLFVDQLSQGFSGLCLTRTHPRFVKNQYNLKETPFIWLSATVSEGIASTIDLTELSLSVKRFVSKTEKSVIMLDGFEFLTSKMGFSVMLEFLQSLNEFISSHICILLLPVSPETLNQKELSTLERELTIFS